MSTKKIKLTSLVISFILLLLPLAFLSNPHSQASNSLTYSRREVLVKFKPDLPLKEKEALKEEVGFKKRPLAKVNLKGPNDIYLYQLKTDVSVKQVVKELNADSRIAVAEPNYIYQVVWLPNDTYFKSQWGLHNTGQSIGGSSGKVDADINAPKAWEIEKGLTNPVKVAVIDTGIKTAHPDFTNKIDTDSYNFLSPGDPPEDDNDHGTHVSGIIAAATNNNEGVAGVAPGAMIVALKAGDAKGNLYGNAVIDAIYYAADKGAKVINMSFSGPNHSTFLEEAVNYAYNKGVVLVAASGNSSGNSWDNSIQYPAAYANVISVGATDNKDTIALFSIHNSAVDLSAPGVDIYSTVLSNYSFKSGTSMAAPMVSGVAALLRSRYSTLTPGQVKKVLEKTATDLGTSGWDEYYGYGRVNAYKALRLLQMDVYPPSVYLKTPPFSTNQTTSETFKLRWGGSDPEPASGILYYDVKYKEDGAPTWLNYRWHTTAISAYFKGEQGKTYYFLVTATDLAGNVSSAKTKFTVIPIDQNNPAVSFSGVWYKTKIYYGRFFKGFASYTSKKGAKLNFSFSQAGAIRLIITKRPMGGLAKVWLNGVKVATVDFYSPMVQRRVPVLIKQFSSPANGKLTVTVPHAKNPQSRGYRVEIDAVAVRR